MPIAKMKRLQVLALERDHDALLRQLERMGCVEISEPDAPDAPESLRRCDSETADCLARQRQVQTAIDALRRGRYQRLWLGIFGGALSPRSTGTFVVRTYAPRLLSRIP